VTHAFGDMVKGAAGILHTKGAPMPKGAEAAAKPAAGADAGSTTTAAAGAVAVTMGEMFIKAPATLKAGETTFAVANTGASMHQVAIVPAPAKVVDGMPDLSAAVAKGKMLMGGDKETFKASLKPGRYEMVCIMAGHYLAGQKLAVDVS
jgi:uncharacterized cupredoxin-like copper-binding protein